MELAVLSCALAAAVFAAAPEPPASEELPTARPAPHALVWANARFHLAPDRGAPFVQLFTWPDAERGERAGEVVEMRAMERHGAFLAVRNNVQAEAPRSCYDSLHDLWAYHVTLYVHADDVAPATRRPVEVTLPDGSGARLLTGTALAPTVAGDAPGQYGVGVDGLRFELPLPADAVGETYVPGPEQPRYDDAVQRISADARMRIGGHRTVTRVDGGGPRRLRGWAPHGDDELLVTLAGRCGDYNVVVAQEHLQRVEDTSARLFGLLSALGSEGGQEVEVRVAAPSTPLYFEDGRAAGDVVWEVLFRDDDLRTVATDNGELRCTTVLLGGGHDHLAPLASRTLALCFRDADLPVEKRTLGAGDIGELFGDSADRNELFRDLDGVEVAPVDDP